jgi:hypothetical protein
MGMSTSSLLWSISDMTIWSDSCIERAIRVVVVVVVVGVGRGRGRVGGTSGAKSQRNQSHQSPAKDTEGEGGDEEGEKLPPPLFLSSTVQHPSPSATGFLYGKLAT